MASLVSRFYQDWTFGLDPLQSRISIFEHIRDIPYSLRVSATDPAAAAEHILTVGKGNCGPKHYLLAAMYRKLGLDVVYATFPFLWSDPAIRYPPDLRRLAGAVPVAYHLACRVRIKNRWVLVDATWDRPLVNGGFPINEHWDGLSEMRCAVTPLPSPVRTAYCRTATNRPCRDRHEEELNPLDGELNHPDEEERMHYYRKKTGMRTPEEIEQIARFYPAFDAWLEAIRGTAGKEGVIGSG
jgi:transglutaminase-like putative cysteine protease